MKEKQYKGWLYIVLLLYSAGMFAQTVDSTAVKRNVKYATYSEWDNWFVSGGGGVQSLLGGEDESSGIQGGGNPFLKFSAGRWFTHVSAIRVGVDGGYVKDEMESYPILGLRIDYMADLITLFKYKESRRFDLYGFMGIGYDYIASRPIDPFAELLSLNVGLQAGYNLSKRISIFAEPSVKLTSDLLDGDLKGQKRFLGNVSLGVTYRFGSNRFRAYYPGEYNVAKIKELTASMNKLQQRVTEKKDSLQMNGLTLEPSPAMDPLPLFADKGEHLAYYSNGFWQNTFVSAAISGGILMGSDESLKNIVPGANISVGKWLSPLWGVQVNLNYGNVKNFETQYGIVSGECIFDLSAACAGYNKDRFFSVIPMIGLGWMGSSLVGDFESSMVFNAGIQGRFKLSSKFDTFIEGRGFIVNDHLFYGINECSHGMASLQIGATYKLGNQGFKKYDFVDEERAKALNNRINMLREELSLLDTLQIKNDTLSKDSLGNDTTIVTEDEKLLIKIKFDAFSSYLDKAQVQNINNIGKWMETEKQFMIKILPFSDNSSNKKVDEILRMRRANAIIEILTTKYGVEPARIEVSLPEDIGYKNEKDCSTIILFVPVI